MTTLFTAGLTAGLLSACVEQSTVSESIPEGRVVDADDLLIVDCLLPGQVRKLGTQMTFLTARRPIQTTAQDCEIRGGEYVAYDRASYKTALGVWMPLAEQGDPDAQNKVGEIYERGIGGKPDYALAAVWYRRAAEQGLTRAQINLAFLLEKGLGVDKNLEASLAWYRKASKLPDAVMIDKSELDAQRSQIVSLRRELDQSHESLEQARNELRTSEQRLVSQQRKVRQQLQASPVGISEAERKRLDENRRQLERQRIELTQRQERIAELEAQSRRQQDSLLLLESEGASLREQLSLVQTQMQRSQQDLQDYQELAAATERELAATKANLEALGSDKENAAFERIRMLQVQLEERDKALIDQQGRVSALEAESARLAGVLESARGKNKSNVAALREELRKTNGELAEARNSALQRTTALKQVEQQVVEQKQQLAAADRKLAELDARLSAREDDLRDRKREVLHLQNTTASLRKRLQQASDNNAAAKSELERALSEANSELAVARKSLAEREKALQAAQREISAQTGKGDASAIQAAELEAQLREREQALEKHEAMIAQLRVESEQWQQKLQQLREKQSAGEPVVATREDPAGPPTIELIDPPLLAVRGENRIILKRGLKHRTVVGQVTAPAGLYALNINGVRTKADSKGLFEVDVQLNDDETPVNLVAIDKQGRRSVLAFSLIIPEGRKGLVAQRINPLKDVTIGRYHALVIGNAAYETLPDLDTALNDADAVAVVLKEQFGYEVTLLRNASRYDILSALNRLRKELTDKDNLLVYYAGHGELDRVNLRGHWLPVDAEMHSTANWISNVSITDILNAMSVRQVLMVADSCYSGALTRSSLSQVESGQSDEARTHWLKTLSQMRSRTALTSGGLAPVLDGGGGNHSVFAKAFLSVLRDMDDITEGQRVYREVSARVAFEATRFEVEQVPEYAPIKYAGHEAGDFLFVPKVYLN